MHTVQKVTDHILYVGASDRRLHLFESVYPIPEGVSYNSYVLLDEKTALFDTADRAVSERFLENVSAALGDRALDYIIVNHMEPDHCATLSEIAARYPSAVIVSTDKAQKMMRQFFSFPLEGRAMTVKENDTLSLGAHTLSFYTAPMVHWPEVMVTYEHSERVLFSADAFGTFGALSGNLFLDEMNLPDNGLSEARRYYTNIVGKYGAQVQALLKKAATLDIAMICPLHGPVIRKDLGFFLEKYGRWSSYTPEDRAPVILYASVYGHTENVADALASLLAARGISGIRMYDVSETHPSHAVAEAFRASHLILCSTTYNNGVFVNMETVLSDIRAHGLKNRTLAFVENGSWAPTAAKGMQEILSPLSGMTTLAPVVRILSAPNADTSEALAALADAVAASIRQ